MFDMGTLSGWLALRNLEAAAFVRQFRLQPEHVLHNAIYGHLTHLTEYYAPDTMPGRIYFQGNDFVLLYISAPEVTLAELQAAQPLAAQQPETLPSRAGKHNRQFVYAVQGIAFSADIPAGSIDFVEVFLPMTLDDYRKLLYIEPGIFYK